MTIILTKKTFLQLRWKQAVGQGAIFIYPTDTIYGIGCNARNAQAVARIRSIKGRSTPFSVIAPSKRWIRENCIVPKAAEAWLRRLPGPYTLIFRKRKKNCVAKNVSGATLGIRIPKHWIAQAVQRLGIPIITTSVNKTGKPPMRSLRGLDRDIAGRVDFVVYEWPLHGKPSTLVDCSGKKIVVKRRH